MSHILFGFFFAFATGIVVILGDVLLKYAADGSKPVFSLMVIGGCTVYGASALLWFFAMRSVSLAQAGVAYSMFTLIALAAIGALWFGEEIGRREVLGIACACVSMVLMVRVA